MPAAPSQRENMVLNLVCNVALPSLVLTKLSGERWLGPVWGLVVALAFPTGYGLYDFARRRKTNLISILGFVSVLLTGGLGLMKAERMWFAIKEASVPFLLGVFVLASMRSKKSLVRELVYNDQIFDIPRIDAALAERGKLSEFDRLFRSTAWLIGGSFFVSAVLNYVLAIYFLKSPPGTSAFTAELGQMNAVSYPVIALPSTAVMCYALWRLFNGIEAETGLNLEQMMRTQQAGTPLPQLLFSPHGRVGREAFWTASLLFLAIGLFAVGAVRSGAGKIKLALALAATAAGAWMWIAIQIKRWHDRNRPGAWLALHLLPGLGQLWTLVELGFRPGDVGPNRFGERTKKSAPAASGAG